MSLKKEMTHTMTTDHAAIGVYSNHAAVESAVRKLEQSGISLDKISIIGGDRQVDDALLGRYSPPEFVEQGLQHQVEREGIWLGGLLGLLVGFSSFLMPGIGVLVVVGPLAGLLGGMGVGGVMGAVVSETAFHDIAADYRDWLATGNMLVIVHCTTEEGPRVKQILESTEPLIVKSHRLVLRASPQTEIVQPTK